MRTTVQSANGDLEFVFIVSPSLPLAADSGCLAWVRVQQPQDRRCPFLSVCVVFLCVQTGIWLPVFGVFNVRTDVGACDCTLGLYKHCKSLHWKVTGRKIPCRTGESKLHQYCAKAFQSDTQQTELFHPIIHSFFNSFRQTSPFL